MKTKVLKKTICIIGIFLFLSQSLAAVSYDESGLPLKDITGIVKRIDHEWDDGWFKGTWRHSDTAMHGDLHGSFNLARHPTTGTFQGILINDENQKFASFYGWYSHSRIFGVIDGEHLGITPFFSRLQDYDLSTGTVNLFTLTQESLVFNLSYDYSFLPNPIGPYTIGIENRQIIDSQRMEQFTDYPSDVREMMIRIWYPIDSSVESHRVEYMSFWGFQWLKNRSPVPLITIGNNAYLDVHPHCYTDEPLASDDQIFPILIFSPGYDGTYEIYTSFIEEIVSHGFIVVSINHPFVSGLTEFPDGRKIPVSPIRNCSFQSVVGDALYILDYIIELNQSDPLFKGRIDCDSIGMYGHSFGGAATLECMSIDSRIKAGLTLDGAIHEERVPETFDSPFFMMLAEDSFATNTSGLLYDTLRSDGYLLTITGSTHYAFTDVGLLMNHMLPLIPPHLLQFGTIDQKRMVNITKTFILSFFQVYLKDYPKEYILDTYELFPETLLQYKW